MRHQQFLSSRHFIRREEGCYLIVHLHLRDALSYWPITRLLPAWP
nr:MAG TPA: hypothetical protein [Caudoviricetes sp.]